MSFLVPFFLIGFIGLAVPIIIHLWSRNTKKSVSFGSIRFLKETETKTMRSIMPGQWLLLFSRMLLLTALVLIMAVLVYKDQVTGYEKVYLIDTRYENSGWLERFRDTLNEKSHVMWLAEGFPELSTTNPIRPRDYWKLLSNPPEISAARMTVVSPLLISDFASGRMEFPVRYDWIKPPVSPEKGQWITYKKDDLSVSVERTMDEWGTTLEWTETVEAEPIRSKYFFNTQSKYSAYEEFFEAAISTLNSLSPVTLEKTKEMNAADIVFWFSDESPVFSSKFIFIDPETINLWEEVVPGVVQLSEGWSRREAIQANVPQKLLDLVCRDYLPEEQKDLRTMDTRSFVYSDELKTTGGTRDQLASGMLWPLLLLFFGIERWLAFKSDRR